MFVEPQTNTVGTQEDLTPRDKLDRIIDAQIKSLNIQAEDLQRLKDMLPSGMTEGQFKAMLHILGSLPYRR